jgi:uracil-DNA glycosylase
MRRTLEEAAREAATCTRCRLAQGRTQVVYGTGNPNADLMFIGEAPGYHEDKQGEPFVGAAGQLLNRMLAEIGIAREDVYIGNVLKCLRYNAPVQLGDGSWERIGRLVRHRYDGTVMSVDREGRLVPKRVIGWYETPLAGRRVYRLTYASAKRVGARGRVSVELTGDHPVLTDRGYVPVEELVPDDLIAIGQGLSDLAHDVVCGTVLGDGHLRAEGGSLSFAHGGAQSEYARFKAELLDELTPRLEQRTVTVRGRLHQVVHVRTRANRAIRLLREEFYRPKKRVPFWVAHALTPRMLAFWFMDDGYLRVRPGRRPRAEIAAHGFPEEDRSILLLALAGLGLQAKCLQGRISFDVEATRELCEMIAPYVHPSMRYKLDPAVESSRPFDPRLFKRGMRRTMYDFAEVEDVTDRYRSDVTFFCIDVQDTHNFVTAGGVVHNCRPPGNRDPYPDETDACRPWLDEQVLLIDPRVIVTLGNWATRYILGRQVSISRVRGQRFTWNGRTVIPTFHPAAVLHGGGEASSQMTALRADFQEIRRALAEAPPPVAAEEQLGLF